MELYSSPPPISLHALATATSPKGTNEQVAPGPTADPRTQATLTPCSSSLLDPSLVPSPMGFPWSLTCYKSTLLLNSELQYTDPLYFYLFIFY